MKTRVLIDECVGCPSRKVAYVSRREAATILKGIKNGVKGRQVYRCSKCGLWHLGHATIKGPRR